MESVEEVILEPVPDKVLPSILATQVLEMLKQSDEAAKHVYLVLSMKFGTRR
jgi:hypothetical protein